MAFNGHPPLFKVFSRHQALADQQDRGQHSDRDRKKNTKLLHSAILPSIEFAHGEDTAERGISDPTMLGQSDVALDLIVHLVAADDENPAAFE